MKEVISKNSHTIVTMKTGAIVAVKGRREGFAGEHWFTLPIEDNEIEKAANSAIVSANGVPDSGELARAINSRLRND